MSKKVTIYSTPTCGYCRMAKEYFTENKVEYVEHDVAADEEQRDEMIKLTGQMGVPVIKIEGEGSEPEVIIGFNKPKIAELLGIK
jgi:glutaredoxin-like YruB-family protein